MTDKQTPIRLTIEEADERRLCGILDLAYSAQVIANEMETRASTNSFCDSLVAYMARHNGWTERQWLAASAVTQGKTVRRKRKSNASDTSDTTASDAAPIPTHNTRVKLSAMQRTAVRRAVQKSPHWDTYRATHNVDAGKLSGETLFIACDDLGVDVASVLARVNDAAKAKNTTAFASDSTAKAASGNGFVDWQRIREIAREEYALAIKPVEVERTIVIERGQRHEIPPSAHPQYANLLAAVSTRDYSGNRLSVYLYGPTGTGKTYAAKMLAEQLGLPFYFHATALEAYDLAGYEKVSGELAETEFMRAFEHGGVCLLDEMDRYDPKALTVINAALANGRLVKPNGVHVNRHDDFICVAAGNTSGLGATADFTAAEKLDKSTLSRFAVKLAWGIVTDTETAITLAKATDQKVAMAWLEECRAARKAFDRLGLPDMADQRCVEAGANLLAAGMEPETVRAVTYMAGLSDDQVEAVANFTRAHYAKGN